MGIVQGYGKGGEVTVRSGEDAWTVPTDEALVVDFEGLL